MALSDVADQALRRSLANNAAADEIKTILNTASPAELAVIDGVTGGTVTASKAVVVDSNKDASNFRNLGATGTITLSSGGDLAFSGTTGQNEVTLTDNLADALSVKIAAGNDFLVFDSTNSAEKLHVAANASMAIGFFAVTPAARASAYTQTYATADKTHAAPTAAALVVDDGPGTNNGVIAAITDNATTIAAVQELADQINKLVADMADVKQVVNSIIDDLQAYGLLS
jgi:hypothetical protein